MWPILLFQHSSLGFFMSPFKVSAKTTSLGNNAVQFILSIFAASVIFLVLFYIPVGIVVHVGIEAFLGCCVLVSMKQYTIVIVAFSSFAMFQTSPFFANFEEIFLIWGNHCLLCHLMVMTFYFYSGIPLLSCWYHSSKGTFSGGSGWRKEIFLVQMWTE